MSGIGLECRPGDINSRGVPYFHKAEQDILLSILIGIFKSNGNDWKMPRDQFEKTIEGINAMSDPGSLTSFIGAGSIDRILNLGVLDFGESEVAIRDEVVEHQTQHNLRLLPSLRRSVLGKLGITK